MRIGLDLRSETDRDTREARAVEADRLGLWAVLVGGEPGTEAIEASALATATTSIHIAVMLDVGSEHPLTLAEEISVLDHLSQRRALVIVGGNPASDSNSNSNSDSNSNWEPESVDHLRKLLAGHIVDGVALAPPPAQTAVPVWAASDASFVDLSGDDSADANLIDRYRDQGCTHLFVRWPGPIKALARHLVARATGPGFPAIVAELADRIDPPGG